VSDLGRPELICDRLGYPPEVGDQEWARIRRTYADMSSNAMVNDQGDVFYPDSDEDVAWFTAEHGAYPARPETFPMRWQTKEG